MVDAVTRDGLAAVPDTAISGHHAGHHVGREPSRLDAQRGQPAMIPSDKGTLLASKGVLAWCGQDGRLGTSINLVI